VVPARKFRIVVCRGPECGDRRESAKVHAAFDAVLRTKGLGERVELGWQACFGRCRHGPNVLVRPVNPNESRFLLAMAPMAGGPGSALYNGVKPDDATRIVDEHVVGGVIIRDLLRRPES
jgi:(2Fe-2S) ferredoxin